MAEGSGGENQHKSRLANARARARGVANSAKSAKAQAKEVLSFGKKISEHWMILLWAVVFDVLGLIPYLCVVTNFAFAMILWLYFGSKKKTGDPSDFKGIVIPAVIANIADLIFSIVPANVGTTLVRILMSKQKDQKVAQSGADGSPEEGAGGAGAPGEDSSGEGTGAEEGVAPPMSPLKNTPEMKPIGFCGQCGSPVYDRGATYCNQCGAELGEFGFDSESELRNIRQAPRGEERQQRLAEYKQQLAYQKVGIMKIKQQLFGTMERFPNASAQDLANSVAHLQDQYKLSRSQRSAVKKGLEVHQQKKQNVMDLLEESRDSETGQIDGNKVYQSVFQFQPKGRVQINIVAGGSAVQFKVEDAEDYARINTGAFLDKRDISTEDINRAMQSGGCQLGKVANEKLNGSVIVENSVLLGGIGANEARSQEILTHESQHLINNTLNQAFFAEQKEFDKKDKKLREDDSITKEEYDRQRFNLGIEGNAKDEISAYFRDGSSAGKIEQTLLGKDTIYTYGRNHGAKDGNKAENGMSHQYNKTVKRGIDSFSRLLQNGYTKKQANDLLFNEPLRNWSRVVERAVGPKK